MKKINRREALKMMGVTSAMMPFGLSHPLVSQSDKKLKILVAGAHPDDPETGCGGTMALLVKQGHDVISLYLTRGEAGIPGKSHNEAARIRTAEAEKACQILGVRPLFAGQIDGASVVDNQTYKQFNELLDKEKPDVLFTQWPVDSHRDHRATSILVYDVWLNRGKKESLYYYEVLSGIQTEVFHPSVYVDITTAEEQKRKACYAHKSQNPDEFYAIHKQMAAFRGLEQGCKYAEAFIYHNQSPQYVMPS